MEQHHEWLVPLVSGGTSDLARLDGAFKVGLVAGTVKAQSLIAEACFRFL
jgi:hypothetical protein